MKLCFPVQSNEGLESTVYNHFGSAPSFVVVDTNTNDVSTITNNDRLHVHGSCNPIKALDNQTVDAVIVGGIGGGALGRLNQAGIRVYKAAAPSIRENMDLFASIGLAEYKPGHTCGGHGGSGGACSH